MYELDHMLNGKGSRQHHQEMVKQAQQEKFAREFERAQHHHPKTVQPPRSIFATVINRFARVG